LEVTDISQQPGIRVNTFQCTDYFCLWGSKWYEHFGAIGCPGFSSALKREKEYSVEKFVLFYKKNDVTHENISLFTVLFQLCYRRNTGYVIISTDEPKQTNSVALSPRANYTD
jgi:hypothetical protein